VYGSHSKGADGEAVLQPEPILNLTAARLVIIECHCLLLPQWLCYCFVWSSRKEYYYVRSDWNHSGKGRFVRRRVTGWIPSFKVVFGLNMELRVRQIWLLLL